MKLLLTALKNFYNRDKEKPITEREIQAKAEKQAYDESKQQLDEATRALQQVIEENHFTINIRKAIHK